MRRLARSIKACGRRLSKDSSGATAVEFGMVLPVFITLIMAILYLGFNYYVATRVERAAFLAQEQIRYAATRPASLAQVQSIVCGSLGGLVDCGGMVVHVAPLSQLPPNAPAPTVSGYTIIPDEPAMLRIVTPPSALLSTFGSFFGLNPSSLQVRANVFFHARP